jgi:hypothetical protein
VNIVRFEFPMAKVFLKLIMDFSSLVKLLIFESNNKRLNTLKIR